LAELKANSHQVATLDDAVQLAATLAKGDATVLLSPACASLDMFKNYQQRGDLFVKAVNTLVAKQGGQR
jgi:UDP-N-acetylmuramoylalanine--D-glutamate ligase